MFYKQHLPRSATESILHQKDHQKTTLTSQASPTQELREGSNQEQLGLTRNSCSPATGVGAEPISAPAHTHFSLSAVQDVHQKGIADGSLPCAWAWCLVVSVAMSESVQFSFGFFFPLLFQVLCLSPRLGKALEGMKAGVTPETAKWLLVSHRESSLPWEQREVD